jgi:cytidylate kinase
VIDERTRSEAKKGNVVIEGQLAGWVVGKEADVRVYLMAEDEERYSRIARRDNLSKPAAAEETKYREENQKERYKRYYGIDIDDLSIYQLKIDTSGKSVKEVTELILNVVQEFIATAKPGIKLPN